MSTSTSKEKLNISDGRQGLSPLAGPENNTPRPTMGSAAETYGKRSGTAARIAVLLTLGVIFLAAVVIYASYSNRANYYLKATQGAIEIWQGRFAPLGTERLLILPGAQPPLNIKDVYSKNEIKTIAFNYYIDRADTLLEAPDMPDFNGIKFYLQTAISYGVTGEQRRVALKRLTNVDMMIYLYKADVASSKGTLADFKKALAYMDKAAALDLDAAQSDLVNMKIQSIKELMAALQDKPRQPSEASPDLPKKPQPDSKSPVK